MFKKSRRKIVASILSVLVLLLFGTFYVIYLASYADMTTENRQLLEEYVDTYVLQEAPEMEKPAIERPNGAPGGPPRLELSTFYSVAISDADQVLKVDTADIATLDADSLSSLASEIIQSGKTEGFESNLIYRVAEKEGYTLVAFLDNTVMLENASTLINYTLIFGGVALVLLFFLARYLASRIVSPLEESYQKQRQFISDAGHELKTPVAVVNANIDLLSREIGENQWLANIQYENERMSALILQLLDLARAENGSPKMEILHLSRLVCGETLPLETVAYENGLTLNSHIEDNIFVLGNSVQLKQLTSILIDNAIRHSDSGKEVFLSLKKEKSYAILSLVNDGEPIPPEAQKQLFERFYRTDTARASEGAHYGLGLAIANAIVVAHRGTIQVQCHQGKVVFTARLPLETSAEK